MTLSPFEVEIAWRALIDEPVPDAAVIQALCALPSLAAMRRMIMETHGFQVSLPRHLVKVPIDAPALSVEIDADPVATAAMLEVVRRKWRHLGTEVPHWAMLAREEHRPDKIDANQQDFDASGQADLDRILTVLARHGILPGSLEHVCDFGCGAGRVALPMANRFPLVTGVDVSEPLLNVARAAVLSRGIANIRFAQVDTSAFGMTEPFDLWFSHLVLQHNPPPIMAMILRRMLALQNPGGVALFQIPTYIRRYRFDTASYLREPPENMMEVHMLPQPFILALAREADCDVLEICEDGSVWPPSEVISNVILLQKRRSQSGTPRA